MVHQECRVHPLRVRRVSPEGRRARVVMILCLGSHQQSEVTGCVCASGAHLWDYSTEEPDVMATVEESEARRFVTGHSGVVSVWDRASLVGKSVGTLI